MDINMLRDLFMWCSIINIVGMVLSLVMCILARDLVYRIHTRFFPMSREAFNITIYSLLGGYKILVVFFNIIPYIALAIIG